jgi:hypothetical protein
MTTQKTSLISAEVILKSKSDRSLASAKENITAENIEEFRPAEETITAAIIRLRELGFTVSRGGITLTILGEPKKEPNGGTLIHTDRELSIPASLSNMML